MKINNDIYLAEVARARDIFAFRMNTSISHSVMQRASRVKCGKVFARAISIHIAYRNKIDTPVTTACIVLCKCNK
jgi:hypothetical protein